MRTALAATVLVAATVVSPPSAAATQLDWGRCDDADLRDGGFQCATLTVPLDRTRPKGATVDLALVRHAATGGDRIGSLVFNPGGPGGSGTQSIGWAWSILSDDVKARFDLVTWDPRGVNESGDSLRECPAPMPARPATGKVNWRNVTRRFAKDLAEANRACQREHPRLIQHMSTNENVADLERIRAALGDAKLSYWGMSYGTRIGYVYALTHPQRVRALILDGSIDPTSTLLGLTEGGAGPDQAFGAFADLYPGAARKFTAILRSLKRQTVQLPKGQRLDRWVVMDLVSDAIAQQSAYPSLASFIGLVHTAMFGTGDARAEARTTLVPTIKALRVRALHSSNAGSVFSATNCADYPQRPGVAKVVSAVRAQKRLAPRFGATLSLQYGIQCAGLRMKADPVPLITGSGSQVPVLVLGASRDGSTVVQWTARMSRAFPRSRTVTYAGGQHVTWGAAGSQCVDQVADTYMLTRTLPAADVGCPNAAKR